MLEDVFGADFHFYSARAIKIYLKKILIFCLKWSILSVRMQNQMINTVWHCHLRLLKLSASDSINWRLLYLMKLDGASEWGNLTS